jgi:hypothetical protein
MPTSQKVAMATFICMAFLLSMANVALVRHNARLQQGLTSLKKQLEPQAGMFAPPSLVWM